MHKAQGTTTTRSPRGVVMLALVAGLAACGGGGGGTAVTEPPPVARNEAAIATAQAGDILGYVKGKLVARGPQGAVAGVATDAPAWLGVATTASGTATRTGTTVQEAGVDEDDLLKTDGERLYTLAPLVQDGVKVSPFARLTVYDRDAQGRPVAAGEALLATDTPAWTATRGMQLEPAGRRVVVLGESSVVMPGGFDCPPGSACIAALLPYRPVASRVQVQLLDASRPAAMPAPERLEIEGRLIGSRRVGSVVVLVLSHTPQFAFDRLPVTASAADRQAALDRMTVADVLPKVRVNGGAEQPLVAETDCWLQRDNASTQIAVTTITTVDLAAGGIVRESRCFVGGTEALYMSPASIWLATSRWAVQTAGTVPRFAPDARTDIHKFTIDGRRVAYRGSGFVEGHLGWDRERSAYRMSEQGGDLRVLTFTGSAGWASELDAATVTASPATLTVLRERPGEATLQAVGRLPNARRPAPIGKPGEQVYAVRFVGDRGYVVTFRRTDPLYVLDLSDPTDPRTVGELEVPGFSDWLFPIDSGLLFGVGKDADAQGRVQGVKVALFDVADASRPRLVDSRVYGGAGSATALDSTPHGISIEAVAPGARLALPMQIVGGARGSLPLQTMERFEVDRSARRLTFKPTIDIATGWADLGSVRTLQLGDRIYHLRDGRLMTMDW